MLLHPDMGFPEKEPEGMQWPVAGVSARASPLRPVNTRPSESSGAAVDGEDGEYCSGAATTPTAKEARIPELPPCPPAPRKRKPPLRCTLGGGREFFTPPDLETVFMRRPERAK
uniref:Cleavage and polyadenylation specificity factor subunit 1 n=1 Tax=Anthurium amnicola TaxID=1678845 RepID=A0A1D1YZ18_9ARAE